MIESDLEFEWDADKAERNYRKHGVRFETATEVFFDPDALIEDDAFAVDEHRDVVIGATTMGVLVVVATERHPNVTRIISARRATKHERRRYQEGQD